MNTYKKLLLVTLVALLAVSAFTTYVGTVNAQSSIDFETSISATDPTVNTASSYTFTITNTGDAELTSMNVTVPLSFTNVENVALTEGSPSDWTITYVPPVEVSAGVFNPAVIEIVNQTSQGLTNGHSVAFTFDATNAQVAGDYSWATNAVAADGSKATVNTQNTILITSFLPVLAILGIAVGIAFLNTGVNRALINYFIGWEQYRVMQKEMAEFRSEQMAAARANDKKQMEKLKRKQSQINNMQAKMMKPQMLQIGISFLYLIVWFLVLIPTFGNTSLAYLPGFGPIAVVWLYPICSLFLGLIASRVIGIMPIDNTQ